MFILKTNVIPTFKITKEEAKMVEAIIEIKKAESGEVCLLIKTLKHAYFLEDHVTLTTLDKLTARGRKVTISSCRGMPRSYEVKFD